MTEKEIIQTVLEKNGFSELNPVQKDAINTHLLKGKNLIIAAPTSSGKTLIAELALINVVLNNRKKVVYLSPLVALAREKYQEFKNKYYDLGIKVALSVGNYDSDDQWLINYNALITSYEKMDSLLRHQPSWIKDIGLIIVDEIHTLNDVSRGPTLEILLTILKENLTHLQILALSATIKNAQDLACWLNAQVVFSTYRPTPLYRGIAYQNEIDFPDFKKYSLNPNLPLEEAIAEDTLMMKKQMIFFLSSRRNAESLAKRLAEFTHLFLTTEEKEKLKEIALKIKTVLEQPTQQCQKLAECVKKGVAFYHSGLLFAQREIIEEAYRNKLIKIITSTTALAIGINLPNFRAVIRDTKRYLAGLGSVYLPSIEVEQMFGRSGRPTYDQWGEGILYARYQKEANEFTSLYLQGIMEEISSKIESENSLRLHLLSLIANRFCQTKDEIYQFLKKTFFGFKYDIFYLKEKTEEVLEKLKEWNFIYQKQNLDGKKIVAATSLGERVSQLYLNPLTAHLLIDNLLLLEKETILPFPFFCLLAQTQELKPSPSLLVDDVNIIEKQILKNKEKFFFDIPDEFEDEYEEFLKEAKLATIFYFWINEAEDEYLFQNFKISPGDLRLKLEISDWLMYSLVELSKLIKINKEIRKSLKQLRVRMAYGVKEELLELVKLKGIGRVRARALFNAGIKTIADVKKVKIETLEKILKSKALAEALKRQTA